MKSMCIIILYSFKTTVKNKSLNPDYLGTLDRSSLARSVAAEDSRKLKILGIHLQSSIF